MNKYMMKFDSNLRSPKESIAKKLAECFSHCNPYFPENGDQISDK